MFTQTNKLVEFSVEEHDYLTEFVDFKSGKVETGTRYLVYNREKKLISILKIIIDNELNELERSVATAYWCDNISAEKIARQHNLSRSSLYRIIENIRKKIEHSMKYVLMYDGILLPKSMEEILSYARKYQN